MALLAAQADEGRNGGETVGSLIQAIRQKHCRHRLIHCGKWLHEDKEWAISGTCVTCGFTAFRFSITDECVENMYKELQEEKQGEENR